MTFRFPKLRAALLAFSGTLLTAAGQFPAAPVAALQAIVAPAEVAATDISQADPEDTASYDRQLPQASNLSELVAQNSATTAYGDRECLARAVYFEARGEPLEGQLAVAQVILNRVASGHFASTVCGVIAQHGQFSFDRSRTPADGRDWRVAKAIAAIAATASWEVVAPRATAFHATRVAASWSTMHKVGTIGNHVFYR